MHLFRVQPISNLILRLPITEGSVDSDAYEIASAIVTRRLTSNEGEFIIDTRFGNIMSDTVDNQKCVNRFAASLENNLLVSATLNITRLFILDSVF